jgi:hypothetical protein
MYIVVRMFETLQNSLVEALNPSITIFGCAAPIEI